MKKIIVNIFFLIFIINLSGCSVVWVPNNNYSNSRNRHIHNEYCGHSGYYYKNHKRKNTNLHYYDPNTGKRKHYGKRYYGGVRKHIPKWLQKWN